MSEGWVM